MKNTTFIYALVCPISNKVRYIGKANNPKDRLSDHRRIRDNNLPKKLWIKSLLEMRLSPILLILEEVDMSVWKDKEKFYINKYKDLGSELLNICGGANGSHFGNKGSFDGSNARKLICLNKDGTYKKEYKSVKDAKIEYGSSITSVLSGKTKTAYGYIWIYKDEYENLSVSGLLDLVIRSNNNMSNVAWKNGLVNYQFKKGHSENIKEIHQYTMDNQYIKSWNSVCEASLEIMGKNQSHISSCAYGKRKTAYGFKWSYEKPKL